MATLTPAKRKCEEANSQTPKRVCLREQDGSPKVERQQFSIKSKREILEAYAKLPKMSKEKAAGLLNIKRPFLYKLLNERDKIFSPDSSRNSAMKRVRVGNDAMVEEACVKWIREKRNQQQANISHTILID